MGEDVSGSPVAARGRGPEQGRIVIVSGLPRSGTSMMMQMLSAGGVPAVTDSVRGPDEDNPGGYFETEACKGLQRGGGKWLRDHRGCAVKVVSPLLEFLPDELSYDVIFMERDIAEVLASQQRMLSRRCAAGGPGAADLEARFREHLQAVRRWAARKPNLRLLAVRYAEIVSDPEPVCRAIQGFLGVSLDVAAMRDVPKPALYRTRR